VEFIARLEAAGVTRVEAVSFVNPKRVPQMAGAEEVMAALPRDPARSRIGLALNLRGWERAVAAGCDEVNAVVSASEGFGVRNQGVPVAEQIRTLHEIAARHAVLVAAPRLSLTISVAFGDPFDGEVPEAAVVNIVREAASAGVREIALGDTIGARDPGRCAPDRGLPRRRPTRGCACTSTTRARRAWPTPSRRWRRAWTCSTPAAAASAAAPSRRAPPATSRRRTSSTCWSARASAPAWTWTG
jgi:hydroxymethylglutaryl-CoA lyase